MRMQMLLMRVETKGEKEGYQRSDLTLKKLH